MNLEFRLKNFVDALKMKIAATFQAILHILRQSYKWNSFVIEFNFVPVFPSPSRRGKGRTSVEVKTVSETLPENGGNNCITIVF